MKARYGVVALKVFFLAKYAEKVWRNEIYNNIGTYSINILFACNTYKNMNVQCCLYMSSVKIKKKQNIKDKDMLMMLSQSHSNCIKKMEINYKILCMRIDIWYTFELFMFL